MQSGQFMTPTILTRPTCQRQIQVINLCALCNVLNEGDENGEPSTNHWTICLQTSPASSLKIDMAPWDWRRGKILLSSAKDQPYNMDETLHVFPFTVAREITVVSVIGAINEKERDMFWFSDEDEGCRWWVCQLLGDFESPGIVEVGSAAAAEEYLLRYWINPKGSYLGT
ncbi:hypothetical protein PgNI_06521 [Pyricularia grisea]|uniref:DUF7770 domain-containing protein n=1 Tax=Pyricularia grisea TaxID=148305 RepID=A0A6P8B3P2_PYRGI|nr:hypothetical protein PgNI_06521 [Pyricularia grisea]TLD09865.1 hypothetical protein PgNI_06521 [Pyricularia grisea]